MKRRVRVAWWWGALVAGAVALSPGAQAQDDWAITRDKPKPTRAVRPGGQAPGKPRAPKARPADGPSRDTGVDLIERYYRALLARPEDAFALDRLRELCLARDGNLDGLVGRLKGEVELDPNNMRALEALARALVLVGHTTEAEHVLDRAIDGAANPPIGAWQLRAKLRRDQGRRVEAEQDYTRMLARVKTADVRRRALRALGDMALDAGERDKARGFYDALSKENPSDSTTRLAWPEALAQRGRHAEAAQAYLALESAFSGDPRATVPLLRDAASEQLEAGDVNGALRTLERASRAAGESLRGELSSLEVEVYRRADRLRELAERLDNEGQKGRLDQRRRAALLWDELGEEERAIAGYRAWLARSPRDVDTRARLARLLMRGGHMEQVIAEHEQLVALAPGEPAFVIALAELLRETGKREQALSALDRASQRASRSLPMHRALAELYARWGEGERAERELLLLTKLDPEDMSHVVALGEEAFERGDRKGALTIWQRILTRGNDAAQAQANLAQVLGDHDWLDQALVHIARAVELAPENLGYRRAQASLFERAAKQAEAEAAWRWVLEHAERDAVAKREARQHLVALWGRLGLAPRRVLDLELRFRANPPDLEAGRTLAEIYAHDASKAEAEIALLEQLVGHDEHDVESLRALERAYTRRGESDRALATLERLVRADPSNAASYLTRAVDLSLSSYRDDEALRHAQRALELRPGDAKVQRLVGDLYRRRQDLTRAVEAYQRAASLDPHDFEIRMQIAQLELARAHPDEAGRWLLQVIAAAPDDELVARAARSAMQIARDAPFRDELDGKLLDLALSHPERPLYRRLLLESYAGSLAPLSARVQGERASDDEKALLSRVARRALKPLLEALSDSDPVQRSTALSVLDAAQLPATAAPLLTLAEQGTVASERARALVAVGRIADPRLSPRLKALLARGERRIKPLALWALVSSEGERAGETLRAALDDPDASVRLMAVLGLGSLRDKQALPQLRALTSERHSSLRAAALWAVAQLEPKESRAQLVRALHEPAPLSELALIALHGDDEVVARALFSPDVRQRALAANLVLGGRPREVLPPPPWPFSPRDYLATLVTPLGAQSTLALDGRAEQILRAASEALRSDDRVSEVLATLAPDGAGLSPRALVERGACLPPALSAQLAAALRARLAELSASPDEAVHTAALGLLIRGGSAEHPRVLAALHGGDADVRKAALDALSELRPLPPALTADLLALFESTPDWPTRMRIARVLGPTLGKARLSAEPVGVVRAQASVSADPSPPSSCARPSSAN